MVAKLGINTLKNKKNNKKNILKNKLTIKVLNEKGRKYKR
jgi:hypothetical protein